MPLNFQCFTNILAINRSVVTLVHLIRLGVFGSGVAVHHFTHLCRCVRTPTVSSLPATGYSQRGHSVTALSICLACLLILSRFTWPRICSRSLICPAMSMPAETLGVISSELV